MFFKSYRFKYMIGFILFVCVFAVGFIKMNIVYSSTGVVGVTSVEKTKVYESNDDIDTLSTINDNAFVRIYEEDYGLDIVFNFSGNEKVFSLKLPWRKG